MAPGPFQANYSLIDDFHEMLSQMNLVSGMGVVDMDGLREILRRIDGRGYKAYKEIAGAYRAGLLELFIDHVQGDPFAAPSKMRIRVYETAPQHLVANRIRKMAFEDFLASRFAQAVDRVGRLAGGSGKSGLILIDAGGQEVLERTAAVAGDGWMEVRLMVGLPARGRTVMGRLAAELLCDRIPDLASQALSIASLPLQEAEDHVDCVENQACLREVLKERGLVAFVADGSILPRRSGVSDLPLDSEKAIPFESPESLRVTLPLKHARNGKAEISGLGIKEGVTLITGGGYHGKSTFLKALERCVYPHKPSDGREKVVTREDAVKIRAEDGRGIRDVDISMFIDNLPFGQDTKRFCSEDASGSTSQAANIVEALELEAGCLLLDEDTCATNFMVRDARMQALVQKEHEPITPFLHRVRALYDVFGVSSVLVMGGCGDYFEEADTVIMMRDYKPLDVTVEAHRIARETNAIDKEEISEPRVIRPRIPVANSFNASRGRRDIKIDAKDLDRILFGEDLIDLRNVEQLVDMSQTRAIGHGVFLATRFMDGRRSLREIISSLDELWDEQGLDVLDPYFRKGHHPGNYARPRRFEVAAAINRMRRLRVLV